MENTIKKNDLEILSNWLENDGIRIQEEAEENRELSDEEWMDIVKDWMQDIKERMSDCSMSMREAYIDILQ